MEQNLPTRPPRCTVPWCQAQHDDSPTLSHRLDFAPFPGPDPIEVHDSAEIKVTLFQDEKNGERDKPLVRISYNVNGRQRTMEVEPEIAADFGDLLTALIGNTRRDFACTLIGAFWLAGGGV